MSQAADQLRVRAHLNLVDSSRQLFALDSGATVEAGDGYLLGAGRSTHPTISNVAFRADDGLDPEILLERARGFFGEMGRGFGLWVRPDAPEDRDLLDAAGAAGLQDVYSMPEMVLRQAAEEPSLPEGFELRQLTRPEEADRFWRVAAASYSSLGFPAEVFRFYDDSRGLLAGNVAAFLAYAGEEPVAIAMTIVSRGVAGIYWVGSLELARGHGLGRAVTAAATHAGFDLGAEVASLQASPMGEPIYRAMGYETICDYHILLSPPP